MLLGGMGPSQQSSFLKTIQKPPQQTSNNSNRNQQTTTKAPSQTNFKTIYDLNSYAAKNGYSLTAKDGFSEIGKVTYQSNDPKSGNTVNTISLYGKSSPQTNSGSNAANSSTNPLSIGSQSNNAGGYKPSSLAIDSGSKTSDDAFKKLPNEPVKPMFQSSNNAFMAGNAVGFRPKRSSWFRSGANTRGTNALKIKRNTVPKGVGLNVLG
jgi:hypothetical protein